MKYRMSLDLGVSSIGAAIIGLDDEDKAVSILNAAVRIFPVSEGAEGRRQKRQMRKNNTRKKTRLRLLAKELHAQGFWPHESPETPVDQQSKPPYSLSPYGIRAQAIRHKLNHPYEFGRAILHMAKHRGAGFLDAFAEDKPVKETSNGQPSSYELLPKYMKEAECETIGEYFHQRLCSKPGDGKIVRQRAKETLIKEEPVKYAIARYLVKEEFEKIWTKQESYFPALANKDFKKKIYEILFFELPSAPYANGKCVYVDQEYRLLKAHPLSEERRIFETVNNISLLSDGNKRKLMKGERDKIIEELLMKGQKANKTSVIKTLGLDKKTDVTFSDEKGIAPYLYSKKEFTSLPSFSKISKKELEELIEFIAEPIIPGDKHGRLYREDDLLDQLQGRMNIDNKKTVSDLLVKIPKGRSQLGPTATCELLEILKAEVISHREAADRLVRKGDKRFQSEEMLAQQKQGQYKKLPYYGEILEKDTMPIHPWQKARNKTLNADEAKYGKLANPAVHMMLNQLRLVVNDLIRRYGRPYQINIELGREVGMSAKKKSEYKKNKKSNDKLNEEARGYLEEKKLPKTYQNILKYKLAKEQKWQDAFNPQKRIHPRFQGFEVEHLIPQSAGGTDARANLVLIDSNENRDKLNQFPYEFFRAHKSKEEIRKILEESRKLPDKKGWRFEPDAREVFEDGGDESASDRYLTDTRYMAKLAARYLRAIIDYQQDTNSDVTNTRILTVKGAHTARLRRAWNLDGLEYELMGLNIPRYLNEEPYWIEEQTGEIYEGKEKPDQDGIWKLRNKKNPDWQPKPRIDHRHHALDAIALGCINRDFSNQLNWLDRRGYSLRSSAYPLPLTYMSKENAKVECTKFRTLVKEILKKLHASHKQDHSPNGELHKEKGRAVLKLSKEFYDITITRYSQKISDELKKIPKKRNKSLSEALIPHSIKSDWHPDIKRDREKLEKLEDYLETYKKEAEEKLEKKKTELENEGKETKKVTEASILSEAFRLIQKAGLWKGEKFPKYKQGKSLVIIEKHGMAYEGRNNHRVDFYKKNDEVCWQLITNLNANNKNFIHEHKADNCHLIWSLYQGDLVELDTPKEWSHFTKNKRCIAKIRKFSRNRLGLAYCNDGRMTSPKGSPKYMKIDETFSEKCLSFYTEQETRKIELTPSGSIKKKHKKLWHGKKATS